jgi:PAS domain S-box-containing protein
MPSLQLQLFIEHAPAAIAMFDREMRYLAASRRWQSDHRLREPVRGRSHYDVLPDIPERWKEVHRRALAGEVVSEEADRFDRADGTVQWLDWEVRPWQNADGEVGGIVISMEEITERKQMESALQKSEAEVRQQRDELDWVYQNTPIGLCLLDRNLRYLRINRRLAEMNGQPVEAHLGRTVAEVVPALVDRVEQVTQQILATGEAVTDIEFVDETASQPGATRYWNSSWHPLFRDDGAITGFGAVVEDITARRQAEVALRASEKRFRGLTQAIPSMTFESDPVGGNTFSSETWCAYTGMTAEESAGAGWAKAVHPDDLQNSAQLWAKALHAGELCETRHRIRAADGSYRWYLVRLQPQLGREGQSLRWAGSCTDIEDMIQAEARLRQADKRKDEFLAMLAHELRNPLAPIRNAIHIMQRVSPTDAKFQIAREMINRQVNHITRLVDDLLDATRVAHGALRLHIERVDLASIARQTAEDYRGMLAERGLILNVDIPAGSVWVNGDPTRLAQMLSNLLDNASKFTDGAGTVTVALHQRSGKAGETHALLSVRDTGVGIDSEMLPQVFDVFAQADRSLNRSRGGLGLGLALVKGLTDLHGGSLDVESAGAGQGAEFRIRLPLAEAINTSAHQDETTLTTTVNPNPNRGRRVLVIEDDGAVADSMRTLLDLHGHIVEIANSGETGIASAKTFRPEVLLCDVGLPGMNGYEVARALRADPELGRIHLIAMTGYGSEEDRLATEEAGFDLHLTKPVDPDRLVELLCGEEFGR